jgi:hypothetical protein
MGRTDTMFDEKYRKIKAALSNLLHNLAVRRGASAAAEAEESEIELMEDTESEEVKTTDEFVRKYRMMKASPGTIMHKLAENQKKLRRARKWNVK